jgi:hypothetical protein
VSINQPYHHHQNDNGIEAPFLSVLCAWIGVITVAGNAPASPQTPIILSPLWYEDISRIGDNKVNKYETVNRVIKKDHLIIDWCGVFFEAK